MISRTRSGCRVTSGMPGIAASPTPPSTSRIGYGTRAHWATIRSAATTASTKKRATSVDTPIVVAGAHTLVGMHLEVADNPDDQRYEVRADAELAGFTTYHRRGARIALNHTKVLEAFEGKGVGSALVARTL